MSLSNNPSGLQTNITQEYNDVKDKLADLAPWLERLLVTLAKVNPNDDSDEVERRSELTKSVAARVPRPPKANPQWQVVGRH